MVKVDPVCAVEPGEKLSNLVHLGGLRMVRKDGDHERPGGAAPALLQALVGRQEPSHLLAWAFEGIPQGVYADYAVLEAKLSFKILLAN